MKRKEKNLNKEILKKKNIIAIILVFIIVLIVVISIWKICEFFIFPKHSPEINDNGQQMEEDPTYFLEQPFLWEENNK